MMDVNMKRFSWSAVFAGALVGLGINFVLSLLGLTMGIGAIGFIIIAVISMFFSGLVAGKVTVLPMRKYWGCLYGFSSWCLALIIVAVLSMNTFQFIPFQAATKIPNPMLMITENSGNNMDAYVNFIFFLAGACSSILGGYLGFGGIHFFRNQER